ncbi:acyltransferase [Desulfuromonas sp. DDH964]|uniref:acetyltransferase n=1 Tax=Desulfuromonas sp. DDH964 TaxID=1823759 RepID=UPI00078BB86C|nr:acetyltransferase [Desulfuromonas sp. DDH964]AMV71885.1 acyltransferase [Desulfuromonas sp. DDH964]
MKEKIFVFGASGHAKVVIDIIERQGLFEIGFLVDDNPALKGQSFFCYPVIGGKDELLASNIRKGIVAIGSNSARRTVASWLSDQGCEMVTAIHPSAQVAREVTIGNGSVIMAGAVINSDTTIGYDVIVNTRSSIDHDCNIGDGVHLAPGSTLCGSVTIGEESFVCAGATVIPNLTIGSKVTVGAGSTVIRDVPDGVTVVGSPAKKL